MLINLSTEYICRLGAPVLRQVDSRIFTNRYFMDCMACTFCHDSCCAYGVDIDLENVARLKAAPDSFKRRVGIPEDSWFTTEVITDPEFPSGWHVRVRSHEGACVFRDRIGRGCLIHSYCLEQGLDYHSLKPLVSILFPLTFEHGVLEPSTEILDRSLVCEGDGPSCYDGVRDELRYYFGDALITELDQLAHG